MRFPPSFLDDIRSRVSLSSVVGRHVQWDRRKSHPGRGDFWACCPFHTEKTPSFHAEDRKGRYHCLIVQNALHPVAAIFARLRDKDKGVSIEDALKQLEPDLPLAKLFKKLDTLVEQNIDTYSASFAVFQVERDEKKAEEFQTMKKLEGLATTAPMHLGGI